MTAEPTPSPTRAWLEVVVGGRACGLPLEDVVETMRPLPTEVVAGAPAFVKGLAIVRGATVVVLDLDLALGGSGGGSRFVVLRAGGRHIALLVEAVTGVRAEGALHATELPPLLRGVETDLIEHIGTRDGALLTLLRTVKLFAAAAAVHA
jgi:purine-binding chemotaxis protein CheW